MQSRCTLTFIALLCAASFPAAAAPPTWSSEFQISGINTSIGEEGPTCLMPFQTTLGPRLFVGGQFSSVNASSATLPFESIALWDGAHWSGLPGGIPQSFGSSNVTAITTFPVNGLPRPVLAGFFDAPGTHVGIGYLDESLSMHALAAGPIPSAWFGGAYGWTPPGASSAEIIVTSGLFPEGSDYAYRYTPAGVALLSPGVVTVTNAFAEFDDGTGRALYMGVQMNGAGPQAPITRWNGTTLTPINVAGLSWVDALCVHNDGSGPALYAAGQGFRRLRNGVWESVAGAGAPSFNIAALASFDDGSGSALYAAGQFTTNVPSGTTTAVNIARWRAGVWEALGTGLVGGAVKAMAVFDEDGPGPRPAGLFVVGTFTTAGGHPSVGIARWGVPICRADHNGVNGLEVQDIFDFLNDWFRGSAQADFNGGGLTIQDIFDFLAAWFAGC